MKRLVTIPITIAAIILVASCDPFNTPVLELSKNAVTLSNEPSDVVAIKIQSTSSWSTSVESDSNLDWMSIDPISGEKGLSAMKITVLKANTTNDTHTATIVVTNSKTSASVNVTQNIQTIEVADSNFNAYLLETFDINKDGKLSQYEADRITRMDCSSRSISSLKGIEQFSQLITLNCSSNSLTELDLSPFYYLVSVACDNNRIDTLTISKSTHLSTLSCTHNRIAHLNVSGCTKLSDLSFAFNPLTSIDISDCASLKSFDCSTLGLSSITAVNASGCVSLTELTCAYNSITALDITGCTSITKIDCSNNKLTSLDVTSCKRITDLRCGGNQLKSIALSGCYQLKLLYCAINRLETLDLTDCLNLTDLWCSDNDYLEKISLIKKPSNLFMFEEWGEPIEYKREEPISGYYVWYYYFYPRIYIGGIFSNEIYHRLVAM